MVSNPFQNKLRKIQQIIDTNYETATNGDFIKDRTDLTNKITDIIMQPNKKWKETKKEYEMPPNYFS
jgi:hypothetical protein